MLHLQKEVLILGLNIASLEESWAARKRWREPPDIVVMSADDGEGSFKADGDGEFNPLLEDEDDDELRGMHGDGNTMLYIGSLKVMTRLCETNYQ
jgi:hypothetical protein